LTSSINAAIKVWIVGIGFTSGGMILFVAFYACPNGKRPKRKAIFWIWNEV
jgi:hypothetical protein